MRFAMNIAQAQLIGHGARDFVNLNMNCERCAGVSRRRWYTFAMKTLMVANWKMHPATFADAKKLFDATKKAAAASSALVIVAPPALFIRDLTKGYRGNVEFAVQNAHFEREGAFTGEISLAQAKDANVSWVIVGHAERRAMGETNEDTKKKLVAALAIGIKVILCVGEKERSSTGDHFTFIREQLGVAIGGMAPALLKKVVIAYEPVWAIGASTPMTARDMHEMSIFIRKTVVELIGAGGHAVRVLYGGAIDESTAAAMLHEGDVTGLLVGRASADPKRIGFLLEAIEM